MISAQELERFIRRQRLHHRYHNHGYRIDEVGASRRACAAGRRKALHGGLVASCRGNLPQAERNDRAEHRHADVRIQTKPGLPVPMRRPFRRDPTEPFRIDRHDHDPAKDTRWRVTVFLALAAALNYADRSAMSAVLSSVRTEFGVSDVSLGLLGSLFRWSCAVRTIAEATQSEWNKCIGHLEQSPSRKIRTLVINDLRSKIVRRLDYSKCPIAIDESLN